VLKVFEELAAPGTPLTTSEVSAEFDCTARTIYSKLKILVDEDMLETKKVGARGRVWWRSQDSSSNKVTNFSQNNSNSASSPLQDLQDSFEMSSMVPGEVELANVVINQAFEFIGLLDPSGVLVDVNEATLSSDGLTRDDLVGNLFWEAEVWQISEREKSQLEAAIDRVADGQIVREEVRFRGPANTRFIDFTLRPAANDQSEISHIVVTGQDSTELKGCQQQLRSVGQQNTVIRKIIQNVFRADTRKEIMQTAPETLREFDAYQAAVIGEVSPSFEKFEPWGTAGGIDTFLKNFVDIESSPLSEAISTSTVRTGEVNIRCDVSEMPLDCSPQLAATRGIQAFAAIPLVYQETAYGGLVVYANRSDAFEEVKQQFLIELGEILGYALYGLERKEVLGPTIELDFRSTEIAQSYRAETDEEIVVKLDSVVSLSDGTYRQFWTIEGTSPQVVNTVLTNNYQSVSEPKLLQTVGDTSRFQVTVDEDSAAGVFATFDGNLQSVKIQNNAATMTARFQDSVETPAVTQAIQKHIPDIQLVDQRRLLTPTYLRQLVEENLTDRQQTVIRLAYFGGYYERPRLSTGDELAAELGISRQTFHHHLRKAEATVFYYMFDKETAQSP
jgi:PAS domain S-box-containing protein